MQLLNGVILAGLVRLRGGALRLPHIVLNAGGTCVSACLLDVLVRKRFINVLVAALEIGRLVHAIIRHLQVIIDGLVGDARGIVKLRLSPLILVLPHFIHQLG